MPMNLKDYRLGFMRCKDTIKELQSSNRDMTIELSAMNRVLNAVNNHKEPNRGYCHSENIVHRIDETISDLELKIKQADGPCTASN